MPTRKPNRREKKVVFKAPRKSSGVQTPADIFYDVIPDGIVTADIKTQRIVSVNPGACKLFGYSSREFLTKRISHLHPAKEIRKILRPFRKFVRGEKILATDILCIRKNGTVFFVDIAARPAVLGKQRCLVGLFRDITARKRMEDIMRIRLRLVELSGTHSLEKLLVATLDEAEALTGSKVGFYNFLEADQKTLSLQAWSTHTTRKMCKAVGKGRHYDIDKAGVWVDCVRKRCPVVHNDYAALAHRKGLPPGHAPVIRELVVPVFRRGKIVAILGVGNKPAHYTKEDIKTVSQVADTAWDIAENKRAEEEIRRTQLQYQQLVENAKDGIFTIDRDGRFLLTNSEFRAMLGYTQEDFRRLNILDTYPKGLRKKGEQRMKCLRRGETLRFERPMKRKDGNLIFVEAIAWKTREGHIQAFIRDITERKRAEDSLREHRRQLLQIIDAVPHMIFAKDEKDRFLLVNRAVASAYGKKPEELIGLRSQDIHPIPEEAKQFSKISKEVLATGKTILSADEIFTDRCEKKHILETVRLPFFMQGFDAPIILGVSKDVTEQRKVEGFRNEIIQTVSHEFRTPLSIEKEGVKLLLDEVKGKINAEQRDILELVKRSIERLAGMVDKMLDVSRIESGRMELNQKATDLGDIVREVMIEYKLAAANRRGIELKTFLPGGKIMVFVDPMRIGEVLSNLLDNSLKFTEKGTVAVTVKVLGKKVRCEVRDTGIGIASENVKRIFDKFQQFSRVVGPGTKGLGLGLSITREIVEKHEGKIRVTSKLGEGTTVTLTLPLHSGKESKNDRKKEDPFY